MSLAADPEWLRRVLRGPAEAVGDRHELTPRERQVLLLASSGLHTKGIAWELGCSAKTVEEYWHRMFGKTSLRSRQEIVALVLIEALATCGTGRRMERRRGSPYRKRELRSRRELPDRISRPPVQRHLYSRRSPQIARRNETDV